MTANDREIKEWEICAACGKIGGERYFTEDKKWLCRKCRDLEMKKLALQSKK